MFGKAGHPFGRPDEPSRFSFASNYNEVKSLKRFFVQKNKKVADICLLE